MKENLLPMIGLGMLTVLHGCNAASEYPTGKPNILIIYADDLGYGDIGVNGAKGVETSTIDRLAKNGINFTDAHCSAATCTPSRYSLLTGEYAWRKKETGIARGNAPAII